MATIEGKHVALLGYAKRFIAVGTSNLTQPLATVMLQCKDHHGLPKNADAFVCGMLLHYAAFSSAHIRFLQSSVACRRLVHGPLDEIQIFAIRHIWRQFPRSLHPKSQDLLCW